MALTDEAKDTAIRQWADFLRTHKTDELSAPMYQALNDVDVRDAFLFWQVGGSPTHLVAGAPHRAEVLARLAEVAGETPSKDEVTDGLAIALNRLPRGSDLVDSGTVLVLASLLWDLTESRYDEAALVMTELIDLNLQATKGKPTHYDPMRAIGEAIKVLPKLNPLDAQAAVHKVFGIPEPAPSEITTD